MSSIYILITREEDPGNNIGSDVILGTFSTFELAVEAYEIFLNLAEPSSATQIIESIVDGLTPKILLDVKPYKTSHGDDFIKVNDEIYEGFLYEYLPTLKLNKILREIDTRTKRNF